jgi:diacylglycerol kinase (ATP)
MAFVIALIAHDSRKDQMVEFAVRHAPLLGRYRLIATANTGNRIQAATNLMIERMLPGPFGGEAQVAAEVAQGNVAAVIFLVDPLWAQPQEPQIDQLLRLCNIHNVALATNLATAEAIADQLAKQLVAHLIFNPVAGQGDPDLDLSLIQELLEPHLGLRIHLTAPDVLIKDLVQTAIAAQADFVIAAGGDGTISAVAEALIGTNIPLGIIPRGTANAFANALGIVGFTPLRMACQIILEGHSRKIDAARCNGLPMILLAGVGFEAEAVELASRQMKDQWGAMAYLMAGWQRLNDQPLFDVTIETVGETYSLQAAAITVANAAPPTSVLAQGGGTVIYDDGLLDVTIATAANRLQAVSTMLRMLGAAIITKTGVNEQNVVHLRTPRLRLTAEPSQKVVVDGELMGTTPIEVECIPGGLTVLVPKVQNSF